mgnify:CR=1 FL=1
MQQKEVILEGTIKAFNEKGLKFTMDDVAKILGMSKKTIYTVGVDVSCDGGLHVRFHQGE